VKKKRYSFLKKNNKIGARIGSGTDIRIRTWYGNPLRSREKDSSESNSLLWVLIEEYCQYIS
jgi:hypothetical protein